MVKITLLQWLTLLSLSQSVPGMTQSHLYCALALCKRTEFTLNLAYSFACLCFTSIYLIMFIICVYLCPYLYISRSYIQPPLRIFPHLPSIYIVIIFLLFLHPQFFSLFLHPHLHRRVSPIFLLRATRDASKTIAAPGTDVFISVDVSMYSEESVFQVESQC